MDERFSISPRSRFLTPGAPGLGALVAALRAGASIRASQATQADPITRCDTPRPALFCETSGSSGAAKVIRRRPASWRRSFEVNRGIFALGPGERYGCFGHLGHSLTLYAVLEALHLGADIACLAGRGPKRQVDALREMAVTVLYATPSQLQLLARGAEAAGIEALPGIRRVFCGGGTLDAALRQRLARLFPDAELREFFGASETSFITISDAKTPPGSVGRAYPGVALRIAGGEPGEIWVRSPYLFEGYDRGGSDDTRWDGDWLSIGEIGQMDARGNLFLRGRKGRMVTVADRNVFPEEIERLIGARADVVACAVLAEPDPLRGHRLHCFVEGTAPERALRLACRAGIGPEAVPHRFTYLARLPLLPAGKPDLQALQARIGAEP
ncbi:MAG: acyl--CoA ligase [Rhodobacteraceae bacterium]|nr:MAG: acyl--CoA ligase [Paracoccaceae bacterium]